MKLIACLGERGGISFSGRRQSRDREVTADILRITEGELTVAPASEKLFSPHPVRVSEDPFLTDGYCFTEDVGGALHLSRIDTIIIYRWNVLYPMDKVFDIDPLAEGFTLSECTEFSGHSHERITREVYKR